MPTIIHIYILRKNGVEISELFVDHEAEDPHHGGTTIVEFNGPFFQLFVIGKRVPAVVEAAFGIHVTKIACSGCESGGG